MSTNNFDNVNVATTLLVNGSPVTGVDPYVLSAVITSSTYTITSPAANLKNVYQLDSSSNAITITLPLITTTKTTINIIDVSGSARANNITIVPNVADTILGFTSLVINNDYNGYQLISNNTTSQWLIS